MEGEFYITNYLVCVFDIYLMYDFTGYYEGVKTYFQKGRRIVLMILFMALLVFSVNMLNSTTLNLVFTLTANFLFICLVMKGRFLEKFMHFLTVLAVQYGGEFLGAVFFARGLNQTVTVTHYTRVYQIVIVKLITFIIYVTIKQLMPGREKGNEIYFDVKTFLMFIIVPLASLGIMFSLTYMNIDFSVMPLVRGSLTTFYSMLILGNALVYYAFRRYGSIQEKIHLQKKLIAEQEMELHHFQQVEYINRKNAEFRHDIDHYLRTIGKLAEDGHSKEILSILKELRIEFYEKENAYYCGNAIINTLLNEEKEEAENKNIAYDIYVEPGFHIGSISETDMISIMGNLYKNALEAAVQCDKGFIRVKMFMQNDGCFAVIKLENSFEGNLLWQGEQLLTTKADGANHGIGVGRVRELAEKYHGTLVNRVNEQIFQAVLVLAV